MKARSWKILTAGMLAGLTVGGGLAIGLSAAPTTNPSDRPDRPDRSDRPIIPPWQERRPYNRPEGLRPEGMRPEGMRGEGMPPMRAGEWRRGLNNPAATRPIGPEEMQDIDHFMKLWSPKRWARLKEMPEDRQERLRGFVAARYRALQELKQNDREMYDIRLGRLQIEDEIFDLGWKLKNDPDSAETTRSTLRGKVGELVENRIKERRQRVATLTEKLETEKQRLAAEEANKDGAIDASMNAIDHQRWPGMGEMVPPIPGGGGPPSPTNASPQGARP